MLDGHHELTSDGRGECDYIGQLPGCRHDTVQEGVVSAVCRWKFHGRHQREFGPKHVDGGCTGQEQ
eukprot:53834-Eustigmatos_ZCMA.PRE.1